MLSFLLEPRFTFETVQKKGTVFSQTPQQELEFNDSVMFKCYIAHASVIPKRQISILIWNSLESSKKLEHFPSAFQEHDTSHKSASNPESQPDIPPPPGKCKEGRN